MAPVLLKSMEIKACVQCQKTKSLLNCGICSCSVCKNCADFLAEDSFSFLNSIPENLQHSVYCHACFDQNVEGELQNYNQLMDKAKEIMIFTKSQAKETRFVKRDEDPIKIISCDDRDETIMRMAFQAVQLNYNAVIDVDLRAEKIRQGAYQTQKFSAIGIPAYVIESKLVKDRSIWSAPN
jgi:uncharacterized protein YbjQ (UPF0145 family)